MFSKCFLLLFVLGDIGAQYYQSNSMICPLPRFEHGRFRMRQKSKLIKFVCFPTFTLVGNKYATCRNGEWDVPLPVCVKPGCQTPSIDNGIVMTSHGGAWVLFYCFPQHNLVGSQHMYCDGWKWNGTAPTCVDSTAPSRLSCDFEDTNLCGWSQDDLHDFDWKRLNKKTPSSFLFTGPSYDHTYGEGGNGYYMYIESTSRLENETARLISPIYEAKLTMNGCFTFFYHMYGKTIGGLRVYQKPKTMSIINMLKLSDTEKMKYVLFEKWGNQGEVWYSGVLMLHASTEDFQIVIEGIRGRSFTSDIAIDDVAILQGENCTSLANSATTPLAVMPDSCVGRCNIFGMPPNELGCGCGVNCAADGTCCADFYDACFFDGTITPEENSPAELPQTQKLIAANNTEPTSTSIPTVTTKLTIPTIKPTLKPTTPKTPKPTTKLVKPTTKKVVTTTKKIPTLVFKTSTPVYNKTSILEKDKETFTTSTAKSTSKVIKITTTPRKPSYVQDKMKAQKEKILETRKEKVIGTKKFTFPQDSRDTKSSFKTSLLTITSLLLLVGIICGVIYFRGARGRVTLARWRGRARNDPDVRYLNADVDNE